MAVLTLPRDRVAIPQAVYDVLQCKIDALRNSVLMQATLRAKQRQPGAAGRTVKLSQEDIKGALQDLAESQGNEPSRPRGALPDLTNDLNFWLDRRLYPIRAMVREQAVDLATQRNDGNLTREIMEQAWQIVWGNPSQRRPAFIAAMKS